MAKKRNISADDEMRTEETPVATSQQENMGETSGAPENIREEQPETAKGSQAAAQGESPQEGQNPGKEEGGAEEGNIPKELIAVYPILYLSHQYKVGDRLPANDPDMVQAWLDAGTAAWRSAAVVRPKARPVTAEPGLPGQAACSGAGDGDNLAGKIPGTAGRRR